MLISTIIEKNKSLFEKLIPETIYAEIEMPGIFALGAIGEDDKGKYAAGVLIFSIDDGTNGEENLTAATIKWLYVAEEFRKNGAGDALMKEFFRIMDSASIEQVLCDVPMPQEYDFLCAYLEQWGFEFSLVNIYEMTVELREVLENPLIRDHKPTENTVPLKAISASYFRQVMLHFKQMPNVLYSLSLDLNDYDTDLSCAFLADKDIVGIMLVRNQPSGDLEILLMRAFASIGKAMSNMMLFAAHAAADKYSPDTKVRIVCRIDAAASVIEKLFPDKQPLLVRRGVFSNAPYLTEKEV